MRRFLIPLLIFSGISLFAQEPVSVLMPEKTVFPGSGAQPEMCNEAGTFQFLPFDGQSNDGIVPTIFLCRDDSVRLQHNRDSMISGDPDPATPVGIGYSIYRPNAPTVFGPTITDIRFDPNLITNTAGEIYLIKGEQSGDAYIKNSGSYNLNPDFGGGNVPVPVGLWFAPITLFNFNDVDAWDSNGYCVDVNTDEAFNVVMLNPIEVRNLNLVPSSSGCVAAYRPYGGMFQWDNSTTYDINISHTSNPGAQFRELTQFNQSSGANILYFSVETPGQYEIEITDDKSCSTTATINMAGCVEANNVGLELPTQSGLANTQVCIPVTLDQLSTSMSSLSMSVTWDPTVLEYVSVNANPAFPNVFMLPNPNNTATGGIGVGLSDLSFSNLPYTVGDTMFVICFNVIGQAGACSPLQFNSLPTKIEALDAAGTGQLGLSFTDGQFCVTTPGAIGLDFGMTDITCDGTANLNITPSGGVPPYQIIYTGPGAAPGATLTGINAGDTQVIPVTEGGTVMVTVTDDNGSGVSYMEDTTFVLNSYGANPVFTPPACNGDTTGTAAVQLLENNTIINPTSGFTYNWTGSIITDPTGPIQNPVNAGNYSVTVTNTAIGCTLVATGSMSEPAALARDNVVLSPPSCTGIADGSITYATMGGTLNTFGNYFYTWDYAANGVPPVVNIATDINANPFMRSNIASGTYYVTVTDGNNCTLVDSVVVTPAKVLSLDLAAQTNVSCFGANDGMLELEVSSNPATTSSFTFSYSGASTGVTQTPAPPNNTSFSNVPAGVITVEAEENGTGCKVQGDFTLTQPPPVQTTIDQQSDPSCAVGNDGSITVSATGGNPGGFTYAWTPAPPAPMNSTPTANNLPAGIYEVIVTDPIGCADTTAIPLTLPAPPTLTFDSTSVRCGMDGALTVTATSPSGTTISNYEWINLTTGTIAGSMPTADNLAGGCYQIVVRDADFCISSDTVCLGTPNIMVIDSVITILPDCFGDANGSVGLQMSGGNPPLVFSWDASPQAVQILPSVPSGTYDVTVTDDSNCTLTTSIELEDPPAIINSFVAITPTSCASLFDGGATAVAGYGTIPPTTTDFNFIWDSAETDSIATSLGAGFASVTISDANNCFLVDSVLIPSPPEVNGDSSFALPTTCFGTLDGSAIAIGGGGDGGPYTFDWGLLGIANQIDNLEAGAYEVTIFDGMGCTGTHIVTVPQPDMIMIQDNTTDLICNNDDNGTITLDVTGGNPGGYTYAWDNGDNAPALSDLAPGTYCVTVTDIEGCSAESCTNINNPPPVIGEYLPWDELVCFGEQTTLFVDTIYGGSGSPYQFTIDFGIELPVDFPVSMEGGWHVITYIDRLGCTSEDSIFVNEPEEITVTFPENLVELELGDTTFRINPTVNPPNFAQFEWTNGMLLSSPDTLTPFALNNETTTFTLTVVNEDGCVGEGSITIEIDPNRNIYIPNIFNPASTNGFNERFTPYVGFGVTEIQLMHVYDRWGNLMFERTNFLPDNNDFSEGWDGRHNGKRVNPGVYVYVVKVLFRDGRELTYRGDVTLIR